MKVIQREEEGSVILEFPELSSINNNDVNIHAELLNRGLAVGIPGALILTRHVVLVAGKEE